MASNIFSDIIKKCKNEGFLNIGVSRILIDKLNEEKISKPTEIQRRVIPVALKGVDIFACAKTGSGKTLAYVLPLIQRMINKPKMNKTTRALIIVPTRELASQVFDVIKKYAYGKLTSTLIIGGQSNKIQESRIRSGSDIIVCTPGRIIDHIYNCPSFVLHDIEILILDEADRLLDDNFYEQLKEIVKHSSRTRQTMLFSATLNEHVNTIACLALKNPIKLFADEASTIVGTLAQNYIRLHNDDIRRKEALIITLCDIFSKEYTLIFCDTKKVAHRLYIILKLLNFSVDELHGDLSQEKRNIAMEKFRLQETRILVSTSLSSRGLDISHITLVINFDIPKTIDEYVHRVGRTARAGRDGTCISIFSGEERKYFKMIRRQVSKEFSKYTYDTALYESYIIKLQNLKEKIDECIKNDKFEKDLEKAEKEIASTENKIIYHDEIMRRPPKKFMKKEIHKNNIQCFQSKKMKKRKENVEMTKNVLNQKGMKNQYSNIKRIKKEKKPKRLKLRN